MKTLKICLMTLVLLALGFSCSEPGDPITEYEHRNLTLTTDELSMSNPVRLSDNGAYLYLTGDVAFCNLSQSTTFSVSGVIIKNGDNGGFQIRDGEFLLLAMSTGCNLWGKLEGSGTLRSNHFDISASVKSICGTGAFDCNGGELLVNIQGDNSVKENNRMTFTMEVNGSLLKMD